METPILDKTTNREEKRKISTLLKSNHLIEIDRLDPKNSDVDTRIKRFGFRCIQDWENEEAVFVVFTGPRGVMMLIIDLKGEREVYSLIPIEHAAKFLDFDMVIEYLLKDF